MNAIQALLAGLFNDPTQMAWAVTIVAGLAGITVATALYYFTTAFYSPVKAQLNRLVDNKAVTQRDLSSEYNSSLEHSLGSFRNIPFIGSHFSGDEKTATVLIHAGYHSHNALKIFKAIKLATLIIAAVISATVVTRYFTLSSVLALYIVAMIVGVAYLLPTLILENMAKRRMRNLRKYFPDALDLLIVCCEAGLGLLESFHRVSQEFQLVHPYLAEELGLVCSKVRIGFSMQQALKEFGDRTGLDDIKGLNSVIVQSLKLGTGIAATLRVYAEEYRDKRLQQAEEKAAKIGVKMIFPMMFCIWPSFFIVAIGPAVLKVLNVWDQAF